MMTKIPNIQNLDRSTIQVSELLIQSIKRELEGIDSLGVSFSGGFDSSFLVYLVQNYTAVKEISLLTICFPGTYDVQNSNHSARLLKLKPQFYLLDQSILADGISELSEVIGTLNPVVISYMLPLFFVCKNSKRDNILLGQGADELFGGYHWQQELENEDFIEKTRKTVLDLLLEVEVRENKIAEYFGKKLLMPYLDKDLIEYVLPLPKRFRAGEVPKHLVRLAGEHLGLPIEICWKKKKAAQYGSGIMKEMKKGKEASGLEWRDS